MLLEADQSQLLPFEYLGMNSYHIQAIFRVLRACRIWDRCDTGSGSIPNINYCQIKPTRNNTVGTSHILKNIGQRLGSANDSMWLSVTL